MKALKMSRLELGRLLRAMAICVEINDSFDGSIQYEATPEPATFEVTASFRSGSLRGQSFVTLVGDTQ